MFPNSEKGVYWRGFEDSRGYAVGEGPVDDVSVTRMKMLELRKSELELERVTLRTLSVRSHETILLYDSDQIHPNDVISSADITLDDCLRFYSRISVFQQLLGFVHQGMYREHIRCMTQFLSSSLAWEVWQSDLFYPFFLYLSTRKCALSMFSRSLVGLEPETDEETGLLVVKPDFKANGSRSQAVVHLQVNLKSISRGAYLVIGVYGSSFFREGFHFANSLHLFRAYFVNCFVDHHTHEFLTT